MPADGAPPLAGVRVVDFGHYIAGPLAGMLLADQGAEVIKVDRPGTRSAGSGDPADAMYNRGKTRLELDLKSEAGLDAARRLIAAADVVIENFRPGVMDRLGLGAHVLTERHPRLIYLSLPGFASTDQGKANIRAFEGVLNAACGLFTDLDSTGRLVGAPPVYTPIPLASTYGAIHGALAVTLALYARAESDRGEVIEVPLLSAALAATGILLYRVARQPVRYGMPIMPRATQRFLVPLLRAYVRLTGGPGWRAILRRLGRMHPGPNDSYRTSDGGWVFLLAGGNSNHSQWFLKAMGLYDELIEAGMVDRYPYDNLELTNNVQEWTMLRKSWKRRIRRRLAKLFAEQPAAHWVKLLDGKVPFSPQLTADEWLHAPEPLAGGLTVDVEDPRHGKMRQLGVQVSLAGTADRWFDPRAADDGDPEAVLRGLEQPPPDAAAAAGKPPVEAPDAEGAGHAERAAAAANPVAGAGAPHGPLPPGSAPQILKGVRVLDLSNVLAGPCSARTLAEYGADVIKIDPPATYLGPLRFSWFPIEVSQGKRSMVLDLKTEEGLGVFWDLLETADVVVHNFRLGVAERLGIDYERVKRRKPDIVYLSFTAYNGPRPGPWAAWTSFDPAVQGATGIMRRYGGDGKPLLHGWGSCIDYMAGYSAAYGMALALYKRRTGGGGDRVSASLAQAAQLVQAPFMVASESHRPGGEPHGQRARGEHALARLYRARDGWLFVQGLPSDLARVASIDELAGFPHGEAGDAGRVRFLERAIRRRKVAFWTVAFNQAGLGCHRVDSIEDIRREFVHEMSTGNLTRHWDDGRSISAVRIADHPAGSPVDVVAPAYARFRTTALRLGRPMPYMGSDSRAILRDAGYPETRIDELLAGGAVKQRFHRDYLPG
ncbi:MAG: CoA transferase [Spirochaetaceae bacterium]|nr:CoA transferase [Spirochaetaceae bacterium]